MARIIVQAVRGDGEPRRWTLSEHIVAENLLDNHYAMQLLERLRWATADAAALESHAPSNASPPDSTADHRSGPSFNAIGE
jgi:hypothetical protein